MLVFSYHYVHIISNVLPWWSFNSNTFHPYLNTIQVLTAYIQLNIWHSLMAISITFYLYYGICFRIRFQILHINITTVSLLRLFSHIFNSNNQHLLQKSIFLYIKSVFHWSAFYWSVFYWKMLLASIIIFELKLLFLSICLFVFPLFCISWSWLQCFDT